MFFFAVKAFLRNQNGGFLIVVFVMNDINEVFTSNEFSLILFDCFSQIKDTMVYVVMEMGDTDLSRLLKSMSQEKQISITMILYYWTEMLTAVKHIHDNGKKK